ncbi:MAG: ABC transporter [Marmoricola sp.]
MTNEHLLTTLVRLHEALLKVDLALDVVEVKEAATVRDEVAVQLADYVMPRILAADAPLLAVVGGSTGAGKSTLVNSIVGSAVTEAGVLRPTTRSPVLVHNPDDAEWFVNARILPDFRRTESASADPGLLQLVSSPNVPQGIAVLDAPDVDSLEERNRTLAAQLLDAADMWLFVTSAARYADQVPWGYLRRAAERKAAVAIILDRTPASAVGEVAAHLSRMLVARGLKDSPLFTVPEGYVDAEGLLPQESIEQIQIWLEQLAANDQAKTAVVRQTLAGTVRSVAERTYSVADACERAEEVCDGLRASLVETYAGAIDEVDRAASSGRLVASVAGSDWRAALAQVEQALVAVIADDGERAAASAVQRWHNTDPGRTILKGRPDMAAASPDITARAARVVSLWRQSARELVAGQRGTVDDTSAGVEELGAALQILTLSGSRDSASGSVSAWARSAFMSSFTHDISERLVARSRNELLRQTEDVFTDEAQRFEALVGASGAHRADAEALRELARYIDDLRLRNEDWL